MRVRSLIVIVSLLALAASGCGEAEAGSGLPLGSPAPELTHDRPADWVGSKPIKLAELRGKVVLLDVWTFGCWNCYRSFPWLNDLAKRLGPRGLTVIGVHAPEFDHEKSRERLEEKMAEFDLHHPVMIDNDHSYWRALKNRYWPAFYILDKEGRVRGVFVGETHKGDAQATAIEALVLSLL